MSLSSSSSSSSSSPIVAVEKATSDLLMNPDWTMNIDICDSINSHHWQTKDVMKAVKRRLQHRSPKVQLLSLTLIETMVKNCGEYVHFQIAEKNILGEMIKIVKKKADMNVRDKILVLLDSWKEAFGGPGGKHPQYYWAYEELRRSGVEFPKRSLNAAPIFFTPPVSNPTLRITQAGYGMPSNVSRRLDETMATEIEGLSLSSLDAMRNVMELLNDMLQAVTPGDSLAVKDEVIVDLVTRCRANQKKLMQMLTTTRDEDLLGRGLELNDSLQTSLAKHDAIASGSVLSTHSTNVSPQQPESSAATQKASEVKGSSLRDSSPQPNVNNSSSTASVARSQIEDDDEEEDDFAQLARRHSKSQPVPSQSSFTETVENLALVPTGDTVTSSTPAPSNTCTTLALPDPPTPVKTSKEQDIIDLLSITLLTSSASPHTPLTPPASSQNTHHGHVSSSSSTHGYHHHHNHSASQGQIPFNSYVVPWAQSGPQVQLQSQPQSQFQPQPQPQTQQQIQPQPQPHQQFQSQPNSHQQFQSQPQPQQFQPQPQPQQFQPQPQPQTQQIQPQPQLHQQFQSQPNSHQQFQSQPNSQHQFQSQPNSQHQFQPQPQPVPQYHPQYAQYSSDYPPPPWSGSFSANHQSNVSVSNMGYLRGKEPALSTSSLSDRQHLNSFPLRGNNELVMCGGDSRATGGPRNSTPSFIPSYRLFEDLNFFGSTDPRLKVTSNNNTSSSLAGSSGQSMVGGRK